MALLIVSQTDNTFFNLATEEYLLHQKDEDIVFIYVNRPAVVVGKHQNVFDECQIEKCAKLGVDVARRLSGGGTVYHGPGNINFCFIKNLNPEESMVDFKKHLQPILMFLKKLGLPAEFSGRNDILLDGQKISGNAEHIFQKKKRLIHHGTLLFDADLAKLSGTTSPKSNIKFTSHAIKSVRSKVTNIADHLSVMSQTEFILELNIFLKTYLGAHDYKLESQEVKVIEELTTQKYISWEWVYGYSPAFTATTNNGWEFKVKKGVIESATQMGIPNSKLPNQPYKIESFKGIENMATVESWF